MLQWASVTAVTDSRQVRELDNLHHGRKVASREVTLQLGPDLLNLQKQIGQGAFASVYKVSCANMFLHHKLDPIPVALPHASCSPCCPVLQFVPACTACTGLALLQSTFTANLLLCDRR